MNEKEKFRLDHTIEMAENEVIGAQNAVYAQLKNKDLSAKEYGRLEKACAELREALCHIENASVIVKNL